MVRGDRLDHRARQSDEIRRRELHLETAPSRRHEHRGMSGDRCVHDGRQGPSHPSGEIAPTDDPAARSATDTGASDACRPPQATARRFGSRRRSTGTSAATSRPSTSLTSVLYIRPGSTPRAAAASAPYSGRSSLARPRPSLAAYSCTWCFTFARRSRSIAGVPPLVIGPDPGEMGYAPSGFGPSPTSAPVSAAAVATADRSWTARDEPDSRRSHV